jgi:hypothetical protein
MANALLITLVGMGLVFIAILLLWGLMALLVRLTREPEPAVEENLAVVSIPERSSAPELSSAPALLERKRRAAAAAVVMALALRQPSLAKSSPEMPPVSVSAWQAVNRAGQLNQRIISTRKKVAR